MPWPSEVPRCGREPVDRGEDRRLVVGRRLDRRARVAERHDADRRRPAAGARRRRGGGLGRLHPGRLEVVGGHAAGDVEGEDDRALAGAAGSTVACGRASATARTHERRRRRAPAGRAGAGARGRRRRSPAPSAEAAEPQRAGPPPAPSSAAVRRGRRAGTSTTARSSVGQMKRHRQAPPRAGGASPSGRSRGRGRRRSRA